MKGIKRLWSRGVQIGAKLPPPLPRVLMGRKPGEPSRLLPGGREQQLWSTSALPSTSRAHALKQEALQGSVSSRARKRAGLIRPRAPSPGCPPQILLEAVGDVPEDRRSDPQLRATVCAGVPGARAARHAAFTQASRKDFLDQSRKTLRPGRQLARRSQRENLQHTHAGSSTWGFHNVSGLFPVLGATWLSWGSD